MKYEIKKLIAEFVEKHNDGSNEAKRIIKEMQIELNYADVDCFSISTEDLDAYSTEKFKAKLGKGADEAYTIEDCLKVANDFEDTFADDFGNDLSEVMEYYTND